MQVTEIAVRRKGLAAVSFFPPAAPGLPGAEYEGERVLLDRVILTRCGIETGSALSDEDLKQLIYVSECYRAKQRAIWYLSQSDHSEKALYDKLCRGFSPRAAAFAVSQMCQKGYLDDRQYAVRLVKRLAGQNLSERAVREKLYQKGLPADLIREILEEEHLEMTETDRAVALLESQYRNRLSDPDDVAKTVAALQRRGFSYETIKESLKRLLGRLAESEEL